MKKLAFTFSIFFSFLFSCNLQQADKPAGPGGWLKGNTDEKFETIARQLRGFDMAMVETGYRYQELYWAGRDGNWDYAKYQLEKIKLSIENGLERRPKRAKSAAHFLTTVLPEMQKSVESRDSAAFVRNFEIMTVNCNSCHLKEQVPYFTVKTPVWRQSPIRRQ